MSNGAAQNLVTDIEILSPNFKGRLHLQRFNSFSLLKLSKILWDREKVLQPQGLFILLNFQRFAANKGMVEVCKVREGQGKDWKKTKHLVQ